VDLVNPGDSIVGKRKTALLLEIDGRGHHRRYRQNHQQGTNELLPEFPHTAADTKPDDSPARE
jgi:hypothetical protein